MHYKCSMTDIFHEFHNLIFNSDEYAYLGTTFKYNNKFRKAQIKQLNQTRRAMYRLLSKTYQLHLPIDILWNYLINLCCLFCSMEVRYGDLKRYMILKLST